tara:strand:- start:674 stop:1246 length:573 start_codon:yes stop_codon:yes gene_type:complete
MEHLIENWKKFLAESSLSRLYTHIMDHESAILSAFRSEYSNEENYERSRQLKATLLSHGYGVTKVDGSYIENFETPEQLEVSEQSLFVSNQKDEAGFFEVIADLGEEYQQDAVLMIPIEGQDAYLVGTSATNEFPPHGQQISVGNLKMGEEAEFMSKVKGRPFIFKEELETYDKLSGNAKWAVKKMAEKK